jgi:hypothetical protein
VLGALLALWEHRTYLNACLLGLNAFDQWGVELGKVVSGAIQEAMSLQTSLQESSRKAVPEAGQKTAPEKSPLLDAGTQRLLVRWREAQNRLGREVELPEDFRCHAFHQFARSPRDSTLRRTTGSVLEQRRLKRQSAKATLNPSTFST